MKKEVKGKFLRGSGGGPTVGLVNLVGFFVGIKREKERGKRRERHVFEAGALSALVMGMAEWERTGLIGGGGGVDSL